MSDSATTSTVDDDVLIHYTKYPNRWSRIREILREPMAEFFGVMILIIFGAGVDCQVVLSANTSVAPSAKGDYLSISFGWAIGTALGVWFSGGVSGGHINPAVTLAMATFRDFPWRKVPAYIFAQVMGGLCGAGVVYANYFHAIDIYEGGRGIRTVPGTASLFSTYALDYMTSVSCFFDEFVGTAVLLMVVCAFTDSNNGPPPAGLVPLALFITILGIGAALGMQTAYAINPARDLGPRLFTAMAGYGKEVFTYRSQYWLWCPIIAPIVGALIGTLLYDAFIFTGSESLLNRPNAAARAHRERAQNSERQKPIAGAGPDMC
ncbi:major intrinsic protein superfamily membrane channel protein [Daedalea quercina L-15889]|uniref:Major intrinsic protein superfamily membrane channel protein n=1 Tax=Daedalea quercina L-15889 TaxID=1314783 RepID=A0A165NQG5_9APHY|nr:major intrinsic protein superfamily membrane channel protein [Daedalea quercina L-15889]